VVVSSVQQVVLSVPKLPIEFDVAFVVVSVPLLSSTFRRSSSVRRVWARVVPSSSMPSCSVVWWTLSFCSMRAPSLSRLAASWNIASVGESASPLPRALVSSSRTASVHCAVSAICCWSVSSVARVCARSVASCSSKSVVVESLVFVRARLRFVQPRARSRAPPVKTLAPIAPWAPSPAAS
jgi:hypothetical protein